MNGPPDAEGAPARGLRSSGAQDKRSTSDDSDEVKVQLENLRNVLRLATPKVSPAHDFVGCKQCAGVAA